MRIIEIHAIQSYPPSNLNRDENNSPKSAMYGGKRRSRISSQSQKWNQRQWITQQKEEASKLFNSIRTSKVTKIIKKKLIEKGMDEETIDKIVDSKFKSKNNKETVVFVSPNEVDEIVKRILEQGKKFELKDIQCFTPEDGLDIALFGRFFPSPNSGLIIESPITVTPALSTNEVKENEIDFFTCVDDIEDDGAAHLNEFEFNSACYYRYTKIDLDLLINNLSKHFSNLTTDFVKKILELYIKSFFYMTPVSKEKSFSNMTRPSYMLGLRRDGDGIQLFDFFEKPISATKDNSITENSIIALKKEYKETFTVCDDQKNEVEIELEKDKLSLSNFVEGLLEGLEW